MKRKFKVSGMSCAACAAKVERCVSALDGVDECAVNLLIGEMQVAGEADTESIIAAVVAAGYGAEIEGEGQSSDRYKKERNELSEALGILKHRLIPSFILLLFLMYISMGHIMWSWKLPAFLAGRAPLLAIIEMLLSASIMVINKDFFLNGARGMVHLAPNMDTLVALGSFSSFAYSAVLTVLIFIRAGEGDHAAAHEMLHGLYFESAAMILVLITVGKLLEGVAKGKTTSAIRALMDLAPREATVIKDGKETVIPVSEVSVGDILILKRGSAVPVDGEITEGEISVDESMLTGESIPVDKTVGAAAYGGTVVLSGYAKLRAVKVGSETAIAEIIKMVKEASGSKAPVAKIADKVSGIFVPSVLLIALLTTAIWLISGGGAAAALTHGVTVLVISCPCALGLATPVAIMVGSGVGARHGILFKNAAALEASGRIKTVAFDKTGTLTEGKPSVTDVIRGSVTEARLLAMAASAEQKSEHPLASAIRRYAEENNISVSDSENFTAEQGGISALVDGVTVFGGNEKYIYEKTGHKPSGEQAARMSELLSEGKSLLILATAESILGLIAISDKLREDARDVISELHRMRIKTVMITGDNRLTAEYVAASLGIDEVIAGATPLDKSQAIRGYRASGGTVAMVGDGINDSVALTEADVGIAVGRGTDVALESASVVITGEGLAGALSAVRLSRLVLRNIYQNLFWAFIYNVICIPIAAGAFASIGIELEPMLGAFAMSLSSMFVVGNALRINFFKPYIFEKKEDIMQTNINKTEETAMNTVTLNIEGMMCPHCSGRVKNALEKCPAVASADVSHERKNAIITLSGEISAEELAAIVEAEGYKVVD
ncbi:MAG: heavy metal translocating P-type ATPase [Ruminococcaceae bacterium]|nr:heavy metal translocating P-type ATPase [Oscillospiraceae bacterium]